MREKNAGSTGVQTAWAKGTIFIWDAEGGAGFFGSPSAFLFRHCNNCAKKRDWNYLQHFK